jgi:multicomponent Na+:H+ antiporter subunit E
MTRALHRVWAIVALCGLFVYELFVSSFRVTWDVVTPRHRAKPGILAVPLEASDPGEITILANFISLTPGSLSLDVSADRSALFVHMMFIDDPEAERAAIKTLEQRVLKIWR